MPTRSPASRRRSESSTSSQYMKNDSRKPPARSHAPRSTARHAPEANPTSRGSAGALVTGWPDSPAQAIPVKCTTPPLVLTTRPCSAVTSPCQAAQPRPSASGRRIARPNPGAGTASGFSSRTISASVAAAPWLAAAANPALPTLAITTASGASSATTASVPSVEALSTTTSSSPASSSPIRAGSVLRRDSALW